MIKLFKKNEFLIFGFYFIFFYFFIFLFYLFFIFLFHFLHFHFFIIFSNSLFLKRGSRAKPDFLKS